MATTFKNAILDLKLVVNQELGNTPVIGEPMKIDHLNTYKVLDAGSTPDGEYAFSGHTAMTGSAVTLDFLDGLVDTEGSTITLAAGKKVRAIMFKNPSATNNVTIVGGASNGLLLWGAAGSIILGPGDVNVSYLGSNGVTIDATHTNVDCTGTNGQYLDWIAVIG